jgi:hypothetical protein
VWDGGKTGDVLIIVLICQKFTYRHIDELTEWYIAEADSISLQLALSFSME